MNQIIQLIENLNQSISKTLATLSDIVDMKNIMVENLQILSNKKSEEMENFLNGDLGLVTPPEFQRKYKFVSSSFILDIIKDARYTGRFRKAINGKKQKYLFCPKQFIQFMEEGKCWSKTINNSYNLLKDDLPELAKTREEIKKSQ